VTGGARSRRARAAQVCLAAIGSRLSSVSSAVFSSVFSSVFASVFASVSFVLFLCVLGTAVATV